MSIFVRNPTHLDIGLQLVIRIDTIKLRCEREVGLRCSRVVVSIHLIPAASHLLLLLLSRHPAIRQRIDLTHEQPRIEVLPVVNPRVATAHLLSNLDLALLMRRLVVLARRRAERLLVHVVAALAKVKIAQRVLVYIPDIKIGIRLAIALQYGHCDFQAVTADAQVLDSVEIRQLHLQIQESAYGLGLAPAQVEHLDDTLCGTDGDERAVDSGQERVALVLRELQHLLDRALERADVHLTRLQSIDVLLIYSAAKGRTTEVAFLLLQDLLVQISRVLVDDHFEDLYELAVPDNDVVLGGGQALELNVDFLLFDEVLLEKGEVNDGGAELDGG